MLLTMSVVSSGPMPCLLKQKKRDHVHERRLKVDGFLLTRKSAVSANSNITYIPSSCYFVSWFEHTVEAEPSPNRQD